MVNEPLNEITLTGNARTFDGVALDLDNQRRHILARIKEFEAIFAKFASMDAELGFEETVNLYVSEEELALFCIELDDSADETRVVFMESLAWQGGRVRYIKVWSRLDDTGSDSTLGTLDFAPDSCPPAMLIKIAENLVYLGNLILYQVEAKTVALRAWNVAPENGDPDRWVEASNP